MLIGLVRRLRLQDSGYALVAVMGIGLVMLALVATALTVTSSGQRKAVTDQDWNAALAAAYAGLDDYKARLANDKRYVRYGNDQAKFSTGSVLSLPSGTSANAAFNIRAGEDWAKVPNSDPSKPAFFRYEIDNSTYYSRGVVKIRATGMVGQATRSIIADLRQSGFFDYVYFTHFETQDPAISGTRDSCGNFVWLRTRGTGSACVNIQFGPNDALYGDVHSNDRLLVCGAKFYGDVTSAAPARYNNSAVGQWTTSGCASGTAAPYWQNQAPFQVTQVRIPPTNDEMALETRADMPDIVPEPGCMYTGPTQVTLLANGKMRVVSPWTKFTQEAYPPKTGSRNPSQCGTPGTAVGQLGHSAGAEVPVPEDNLIYVQGVDDRAGYPNYWAANARPSGFTCNNTGANQGWVFQSASNQPTVRYPLNNETMPATSTSTNPAYGCRDGDLYISGALKGRMTAAASRYVYITGDLTYSTTGTGPNGNVLGLVAQKAVWVWNPMNGSTPMLTDTNRRVHAALLSVKGTFQVQNWNKGGYRGTLFVYGSMAQNFRGTVAQPPNGYDKDYRYDDKLQQVAPPKFLAPSTTTFGISQVAGVPAAFNSKGAER